MNVKPGDIAVYVGPNAKFRGVMFEVLCAAPGCIFRLPDGHLNDACPAGYWVLKVLGCPVMAPLHGSAPRLASYGTGPDSMLRPLRDPDAEKSVEREKEVPA